MKKVVLFCIALLICNLAQSQVESARYAVAAGQFMELYNNGNYNLVFQMFDADMKKALPEENTKNFLSRNVYEMMGNIVDMQFHKLKNGAHVYRTKFEKAVADISISLNAQNQINGLFIRPPKPEGLRFIERNATNMRLPFRGRWIVGWGGITLEDNYHIKYENQKYAYDFLKVINGSTYNGNPKENQSYHAFGKVILAPCDAQVIKVIDGIEDNIPGETNKEQVAGNIVLLKTSNGEYLLFAHLKQHTIIVKEGENVKTGDVLGRCGNSGNSTEPHLHLSLQNTDDLQITVGGKLYFDKILVNSAVRRDHIPVKNDFVENIENRN